MNGPKPFHKLVADLDYPMAIVTTASGSEHAGCLVGFVSQCSMDPPRLMVWLSKRNRTTRVAAGATTMVIHFLAADQLDLAARFGSQTGDEVDKFAGGGWEEGPEGIPVLTACVRRVVARVLDRIDTGDHVGYLLGLVDVVAGNWTGQLGFQAARHLEPGHQP